MTTPSQALIWCKVCETQAEPHKTMKRLCVACAKVRQAEYAKQYKARQKAKPRIVSCKGCGLLFDASRTGRTWKCPDCTKAYLAQHREEHRQWHAEYSRTYRARLGDEYKRRIVQRRRDRISSMDAQQLAQFRAMEADKSRKAGANLRAEIFAHYGEECACCGESERLFLTIDHIANNGAEQRRNGDYGRSGTQFYQWLRKSDFPDGYQTLCMNCNFGKHRNGGICPHQTREGVTTIPEGSRAKRPEAQRTP